MGWSWLLVGSTVVVLHSCCIGIMSVHYIASMVGSTILSVVLVVIDYEVG